MIKSRTLRWILLSGLLLAVILVPFFIFGARIDQWTAAFMKTATRHGPATAAVLCLLLASDILLPVPSSLVSIGSGFLLGFPLGFAVSFTGMTIACVTGYWLGLRSKNSISSHLMGAEETRKLEQLNLKFGDWFIVTARAIPVLAEASVLFAGIGTMPFKRFFILSTLSNAAISAVYAGTGAWSASINSFLLAFAASILIPSVGMFFSRRSRQV